MANWYRNEQDKNLQIGDWVSTTYYGERRVMKITRIKCNQAGEIVGYTLKPAKYVPKGKNDTDVEREIAIHNKIDGQNIPLPPVVLQDGQYITYPYINKDHNTWDTKLTKKPCPTLMTELLFDPNNAIAANKLLDTAASVILSNLDKFSNQRDVEFYKSIFTQWQQKHSLTEPQKPYAVKGLMAFDGLFLDIVFDKSLTINDYVWLLDESQLDAFNVWYIHSTDNTMWNVLKKDGNLVINEWFRGIRSQFEVVPELGVPAAEVVRNDNELAYLTLDGKLLDATGNELDIASDGIKKQRNTTLPTAACDDDTAIEIVDMGNEYEGFSVVTFDDGTFGYMDVESKVLLCNADEYGEDKSYWSFDEARPFKNGYGVVKTETGYNALNKDGELVLEIDLAELDDFEIDSQGFTRANGVTLNGKEVYVDRFNKLHKRK